MCFRYSDALLSPNKPLGVNTVTKLVKAAAAKLGFNACSHEFHHLFVMTLVNEPKVSTGEALVSARLNSVAAQSSYMACGTASEMAKFHTLGLDGLGFVREFGLRFFIAFVLLGFASFFSWY